MNQRSVWQVLELALMSMLKITSRPAACNMTDELAMNNITTVFFNKHLYNETGMN